MRLALHVRGPLLQVSELTERHDVESYGQELKYQDIAHITLVMAQTKVRSNSLPTMQLSAEKDVKHWDDL